MKIINRYFIRQLITIFVMLILVLTGLAWMVQIMSLMKFIINYGVDLFSFLGLTALMVPFIVSIIMPFVVFIAVLFIYNKLITDNEITVMAAATMSPAQIARPALIMAGTMVIVGWMLSIWIVPMTQHKFYDTQWELRYGLAHMKLKESAFTELSDGLVVYVDKVSGYDLSQIMLSDTRSKNTNLTILAERAKMVATGRGISLVMENGSMQARDENLTIGTFDSFDMDMNIADKPNGGDFRVRGISTPELIKSMRANSTNRQHKLMLTELCNRFATPMMNIILTALCAVILLRSSLLRRRTSFAPVVAVGAMAVTMGLYMAATNMITSLTTLFALLLVLSVALFGLLWALYRK